jgi:BNR repeat protein
MKKLLPVLSLAGILFSCSDDKKEKSIRNVVPSSITMLTSPVGDSCAEPYLFTDKNGIVYLSWIEKIGKQSTLKFSSFLNDKWSEPGTIASGKNWFVNWADYPVITSDGDKNLLAHFLEKSDTAKFTYDVKMVSSTDSGKTWGPSKTLHDDNVKAEHGFVSIIPYNDQFFVTWLDGRKTASEEAQGGHDGHHGEMTLRAALIDKNGNKVDEWQLDERICDCCQTTASVTSDGPIVVYRDRSDDEVRDMSIVRFVNDQWTAPKTIYPDNWQIKACPVNGPRADAINNNLAIAWFSMVDKKGTVNLIFSKDGGATFRKPIRIDDGKTIGRVDVLMLDSATAMVSWMEGSSIKAVKVYYDGKKDSSIMIASSSEARSSGFPQMTKSGDKLFFAWTDDKEKTIKFASISL